LFSFEVFIKGGELACGTARQTVQENTPKEESAKVIKEQSMTHENASTTVIVRQLSRKKNEP